MGSGARHFEARSPSTAWRILVLAVLCIICVLGYVLFVTYHLQLPGLHSKARPQQDVSHATATAFAQGMLPATLRFDADGDQRLSHQELSQLLVAMAHAQLIEQQALSLPQQAAASLLQQSERQGTSSSQQAGPASTATQATQQQQPQDSTTSGSGTKSITSATTQHDSATGAGAGVVGGGLVGGADASGMCPELSRELVSSFAANNTIMLTVSDWRIFETFGVNWMKHLQHLGVDYFLVGATDRQTSLFLGHQGRHPCFKFFEDGHGHGATQEYKYGDAHYNAATWRKVVVVRQLVSWGFNVLHSDVDVVWFRNPLPYFLGPHLQHTDVAVSTDLVSTHNPQQDPGLEVDIHPFVNVNTGVYFVKATPGGAEFMRSWAELRKVMKHDNDQTGLYQWLRSKERGARTQRSHRCMEMKASNNSAPTTRISLLGVHMLLNGYTYFIPQLHKVQQVDPLGVHMTWVPLSREGKFQRMRDGMLYHDPPEYYTHPLLITADLEHPSAPPGYNQERDTETMIQFHLRAMDQQLVQMYRVMAVAVIMNRTLVLPKLKCFCYKNWFMMEQCRIPGDRATQFPLDCTMDQWLRPKIVANYGPRMQSSDGTHRAFMFREHTLLDNPDFPRDLLRQQVVVEPGGPGTTQASSRMVEAASLGPMLAGVPGKIKVVSLPPNLRQEALRDALQQHAADAKIIRLRHVKQLFGGWDDTTLQRSFEAFLDAAAGNWCCRDRPFIDKGMKEKEKLAIHW